MTDPHPRRDVWRFLIFCAVLLMLVIGNLGRSQAIAELGVRYHTDFTDGHPGVYLYLGKFEIPLYQSSSEENATVMSLLLDGEVRYPLEGDVGAEVVYDTPLVTLSGRLRAGVLNAKPHLEMRIGAIITIGR